MDLNANQSCMGLLLYKFGQGIFFHRHLCRLSRASATGTSYRRYYHSDPHGGMNHPPPFRSVATLYAMIVLTQASKHCSRISTIPSKGCNLTNFLIPKQNFQCSSVKREFWYPKSLLFTWFSQTRVRRRGC